METDRKELDESKQNAGRSSIRRSRRGHRELKRRVFSTQRRKWNTHCRLRTNVEQLCATIVRINECSKKWTM